jgi:hypothetical protein
MNSIKRPKRGETEEDLIREQNEFMIKNKLQKVNNKSNDLQKSEDKIADNHDLPLIVCNIVEKNVNHFDTNPNFESMSKLSSNGFPKAMRRSDDLVPKRGKSLFAQQMDNNCKEYQTSDDSIAESVVTGMGLGTNDWRHQIEVIRRQNQLLINNMNTNEVLEMRNQLINKLDKKTIDFIRNKKFLNKNKSPIQSSIDVDMNETNKESIETEVSVNENDLPIKLSEVKDKNWLNMDIIEKEKISWMADLTQKEDSSQVSNSARFDFEGNLTQSKEEIDVKSGLHHHGLQQSSPGYTIQELYTFVESSFNPQKVIGLQVFAKIFYKAYNGLFDASFNENIIVQLFKNSALVLMTRKCLDDNTETVWKVSINALHSMLCNTIVDELYIDRAFLVFNHQFNGDKNYADLKPSYDSSIKFDELNDEQFLRLDAIECLVQRTAFLQRIRFLLDFNKSQLDSKSVNNLLDILIRISRHSYNSRQAIIRCPYLLETIVNNFMPVSIVFTTNSVFNKSNPKALKLIRILTNSDSETSLKIISDFPQIIEALKVYLTLNPENCENASEILQLSIETLRVWMNLMSQKVGIPEFLDMFPIIIKQLQFCQTLNPITHTNCYDWHYVSTLISVVKYMVKANPDFRAFNDLVLITLLNWLNIVKNSAIIPNFDANVTILSAIEFILTAKIDSKPLNDLILEVIDSTLIMNKLMNTIIDNSNLILINAKSQGNLRDSSNLPSYGSIYYQNLNNIKILNENSSICLLFAIVLFLRSLSIDKLNIKMNSFQQYVIKVTKSLKLDLKLNLFDSYELNLLNEICLLSSTLSSNETEDFHCFLNISILMSVIFNKTMHCNKITESISKLSLNESFGSNLTLTEPLIESFDEIKTLYNKFSDYNCSHWVFDPLIKSLRNQKSSTKEVENCLLFINSIFINHKNYLTQMISSRSALFCLISSVFLISDEVFFDDSVQVILYNLLVKMLFFDGIVLKKEERVPHFETVGDL